MAFTAISSLAACGDGGDKAEGSNDDDLTDYQVVNSTNVVEGIPGIKVRYFNLDTGVLGDEEYISDANGNLSAPRPPNTGAFATGNGAWSDTWNIPPSRKGEEKFIRMSSAESASIVPALAGYTNDQEASALAGSVLWKNPASGQDELVGCATIVESVATKDIRYFAGSLPASLTQRSLEEGTARPNGMGTNDAEAGKFFIGNLASGAQTVQVAVKGQMIGSLKLFVTPRKAGNVVTSTGMPSNVTLANIFVDASFTANPTPADCK